MPPDIFWIKAAGRGRLAVMPRPRGGDWLEDEILHLKRSGIGILVTDHNVRETLAVTDRAYIINDGRIFRSGTPDQLGNDPEVRRVYLGENFNLELQSGRWQVPTTEG